MSDKLYYLDPTTSTYHPERRTGPSLTWKGKERRHDSHPRTTADQYLFLAESYRRAEDLHSKLKVHGRRVQHTVFSLAIVGLALFFAEPRILSLTIPIAGIKENLSVEQLLACSPAVMSYLILHMIRVSHTRKKLEVQVQILDNALQRFGAPTPGSVAAEYRLHWDNVTKKGGDFRAQAKEWAKRNAHHVVYWTEDGYLYLAGGALYFLTWWGAYRVFTDTIIKGHGAVGHTLMALLGVSFFAPIVALLACKVARRAKTRVTEEYLKEEFKRHGGESKAPGSKGRGDE